MNQQLEEDWHFVRKWGFLTEVTLSVQGQMLIRKMKQWCPQSMPWDFGAGGSNRAAAPACQVGPTQPSPWQTRSTRTSPTVRVVSAMFFALSYWPSLLLSVFVDRGRLLLFLSSLLPFFLLFLSFFFLSFPFWCTRTQEMSLNCAFIFFLEKKNQYSTSDG